MMGSPRRAGSSCRRSWWRWPARRWSDVARGSRRRGGGGAGAPGSGKPRLLAEEAVRVHAAGATVLAGRAPEEHVVPFQPFVEALGHYAHHAGETQLRAALRGWGPELARLVPEIGRRLPDLHPAAPGDPAIERFRLFEAVATLLGAIADRAPLLLVLDDLHWADQVSLQLLRHPIRSARA